MKKPVCRRALVRQGRHRILRKRFSALRPAVLPAEEAFFGNDALLRTVASDGRSFAESLPPLSLLVALLFHAVPPSALVSGVERLPLRFSFPRCRCPFPARGCRLGTVVTAGRALRCRGLSSRCGTSARLPLRQERPLGSVRSPEGLVSSRPSPDVFRVRSSACGPRLSAPFWSGRGEPCFCLPPKSPFARSALGSVCECAARP